MVISGATDYRRFQAGAAKQRYAIRFPGVTYGRSTPLSRLDQENVVDDEVPDTDPDLLSGVIDAPPQLSLEMSGLVSFKTSTLAAFGLQRNGVWGEETTSQKIEHLGLMLGALAASPQATVRGSDDAMKAMEQTDGTDEDFEEVVSGMLSQGISPFKFKFVAHKRATS